MAIDWDHEVYNSGDNIPGDPGQVTALGKNYRDTADAIRQQAANLRNLVNGQGWDSDSGREFQNMVGDTADKLDKAFGRYDAAAGALGTDQGSLGNWAGSLAHAQDMAKAAINKGREAQANSRSAQGQIDAHTQAQAKQPPPPPGTPPPTGPDPVLTKLSGQKAGFDGDMAQAEKDLQAARDFRDSQANKFADAIVNAYNHDGLKDGFWDKVGDIASDALHGIEDFAQVVGHWAGAIAGILGVLALALSWVPVVGELLGAAAMIASVVALGCDVINALDGRGTWLDVGIDVLGVLSGGAGRLLGDVAKGSKFFEIYNGLKGASGMTKALRAAKAGEAVGITGMKASKMAKAAKGLMAELPESGMGRYTEMAKAAVNPKLYVQGMKDGAANIKDLGAWGAVKDGLAKYPTTMMSAGGKARYIAWGTVPLALGWANMTNLTTQPGWNDNSPVTNLGNHDGLAWLKSNTPLGANGVPGGNFSWVSSG
ncbi:hypothetical protein ABH935_006911 [Catenulispora sp. GAS73]|uniref:putative T7SS-secreted protein n=1 Tax=Catenulispora sp. GAS73 TaxID=3156269 RepID=UPI0035139BE4